MKGREKGSWVKKISSWAIGILLGAQLLGCASLVPRQRAGVPPKGTPTLQEAPPALSGSTPRSQESAVSDDLLALPSGNPSGPPQTASEPAPLLPVQAEPKEAFHVHTVRWPGETLSAIAAWYTGDARNWKVLAERSPGINPNLIHEGNKILIPEMLLKTRDRMPREFLDRLYSKSKKEKPRPKPEPAQQQEGELQLFGPKKPPTK